MTSAVLANLSSPELDRLAVELQRRGSLVGLVRRYTNKGRGWEQALGRLPGLGRVYANTLGRRVPVAGLDPALIIEAGVVADFAASAATWLGRRNVRPALRYHERMLNRSMEALAHCAARQCHRADVVVAGYHVAYPSFRRARDAGRRTILNYPIAHHRWQYRYYAETARQFPEFAAALPRFADAEAHAFALDREIALADTILVGSRFVRESFIDQGIEPSRLVTVPYGADLQRFQPAAEPRPAGTPFRVLFVGQIGERKGVGHLLKAYQAFEKADTRLQLVGDFVAGNEVYAPYRKLFEHTPNVPQARLAELFRAADVFVFPTLVEGLGMVVIEAMACGLPVIVTAHGPDEVVRAGVDGFIVPPCDARAIADALEQLYVDRELRLQMGRNALQQASRWTWQRYAQLAADVVLAPPVVAAPATPS
jgi:glycosyltransferase involved in cell wall biosynthesis